MTALGRLCADPWPDARKRRQVENEKIRAIFDAGFLRYVFDGGRSFGVLYVIDQQERIVYVISIFQGISLN